MRWFTLTIVLLAIFGGCRPFKDSKITRAIVFPQSKLAPDAVGLEIAIVELDHDQIPHFESFWKLLDQQELPLNVRKNLDRNGIRAAVMSSHPPQDFYDLIQPRPIEESELTPLEKQLHAKGLLKPRKRMLEHSRISNREGESHPAETSPVSQESSWVIQDGEKQIAGFGKYVQGVISITTYPLGDGSVKLKIQPEIHHGESRTRIGVGDGAYRMRSGRRVLAIESLTSEVSLRAGESLVIGPTNFQTGLGKILFGSQRAPEVAQSHEPSANTPAHRVLMIRVVQTQMDDLFSDTHLGERLTTTPMF